MVFIRLPREAFSSVVRAGSGLTGNECGPWSATEFELEIGW